MRILIPWLILMLLSPLALWGLWQIIGKWRFRRFFLIGLLVLNLLYLAAIQVGFQGLIAWRMLLPIIVWFMVMAALPMSLFGLVRRRLRWTRAMRAFTACAFVALMATAVFSAYSPTVKHTQITLNKPLQKPLRILLASDIHLYWLFGNRAIDRLAQIAKDEQADIVLLPGDIINDRLDAYHARNMHPHLQTLRAPLGVYATLGNHEYYGGQTDDIIRTLGDAGITVLRDQALVIGGQFVLAGRDDDHNPARLPTEAILSGQNLALPVILLDHRPTRLAENAAAGVDLQVSGHAHKGQIFPANFIVERMYDVHYGEGRVGNMAAVVTSGYGFWGVPLRLGSRSEVWIIDVFGEK